MLIDTHAHLYAEEFNEDRDAVIRRAWDEDVAKLLLPNIDHESIEGMMALARQYPDRCFPMMGLHPCSVKENYLEELERCEEWLQREKFYGIGETGIDLYWDKTFFKEQQIALRTHIEWAKKYKLPIVIHARDSMNEILEIFDELNDEKLSGVFHCFTGTKEQAERIIAYGGFKLGIGGVVTFKNSGLDKVVAGLSLEHLVLETDAPYLAPVPHRGKRNESAYLSLVAEKLATVFGVTAEVVATETSRSAVALFKL